MSEEPSFLFERQLGLVYQERIEDMRVLVTGHGSALGFLVQELVFLGFGSSQGFIAFPDDLLVEEEDIRGQVLLEEEDHGKPMWEMVDKRVKEKFTDEAYIFGVEHLDDFNYDAVVAVTSSSCKPSHIYRIPSFENVIWSITTNTTACVSSKKLEFKPSPYNILQPSLSAISASITATEILRRNLLIRVSEILDTNLQLRFVMQQPNILKTCRDLTTNRKGLPFRLRLKIGGEKISVTYEPFTQTHTTYGVEGRKEVVVEDPDRVILYASFPKGSFLKRFLVDQLEILEDYPAGHFKPMDEIIVSPFAGASIEGCKVVEPDIQVPTSLENKRVYFLGVGGLGSWTTVLFSLSNTKNCTFVLNDHDAEVEEHNLNRQILFNKNSIGKPKAVAARDALATINSENHLVVLPYQLDIGVANNILNEDFMSVEDFEEKKQNLTFIPGTTIPTEILREDTVVAHEVKDANIIVCGPDNIRVRYISSLLGKMLSIPVVNAGAERFEGKMDLFEPENDCYVCRYGEESKYKQEIVSCTGRIPIPSIVTTIATIGSIQALVSLVKLALPDQECIHYLQYYGRYQMFASCHPVACRHKRKGDCPDHLNLPADQNPFLFFEERPDHD